MPPADVITEAFSILEVFVTWRTMISTIRTEVDVTHVSLHVTQERNSLSTYNAVKAIYTSSNLALHQVIHCEAL